MFTAPYQEANEAIESQGRAPLKAIGTAASLVAPIARIGSVGALLSKFIPPDLVKKGLKKIDPRLGKIVDQAEKIGHPLDSVKQFIQDKIQPGIDEEENSKKQPSKQKGNIIQQYSDSLFEYLRKHIDQGRDIFSAGSIARKDPKFSKIIQKMEKDHKADFASILETVFGSNQQGKSALQSPMQQQMQSQQQQQAQPQQSGMNPQIQAAIQKIMQM